MSRYAQEVIVSPDGAHLALRVNQFDDDLWLVEGLL
jgi:hypothetical protein